MEERWKWIVAGGAAGLLLTGVMAAVFVFSGMYPIAANEPHSKVVDWVLTSLQERSVSTRADDDRRTPDLTAPDLLAAGVVLYEEHCVMCHGAPGVERAVLGRGLNPDPPRLATEIREWTDAELFWIVANGLKMAGMPAFQPGLSDREVWATVALMRSLPELTPGEYRRAIEASEPARVALLRDRDRARQLSRGARGDVETGRRLVAAYGCGSCHIIPGVANSKGQVGPPLDDFGLRHYIAGAALNTPETLAAWLVDPEAIEPGTAMPSVGATAEDATHMAAYLLSLGADESLTGPKGILPASWLPK